MAACNNKSQMKTTSNRYSQFFYSLTYTNSFQRESEINFSQSENISKCGRYTYYIYKVCTSHLGLLVLLFMYSLCGAFVFMKIEGSRNMSISENKHMERLQISEAIMQSLNTMNIVINENRTSGFKEVLEQQLKIFEDNIKENSNVYRFIWDFSGSLFYCLSVYTTIGYGNLYPVTNAGRLATIIYGLFGIPLCLTTVADVGLTLKKFLRWLFHSARSKCCRKNKLCCRVASASHTKYENNIQKRNRNNQVAYDASTAIEPDDLSTCHVNRYVKCNRMFENKDENVENQSNNESVTTYGEEKKTTEKQNNIMTVLSDKIIKHDHNISTICCKTDNDTIKSDDNKKMAENSTNKCFQKNDENQPENKCDKVLFTPPCAPLFITFIYMFIGTWWYCLFNEWTFVKSLYFVFTSLSTIGFGDVIPASRYFIIHWLYTICGLSLVAMAISCMTEATGTTLNKAKYKLDLFAEKKIGIHYHHDNVTET